MPMLMGEVETGLPVDLQIVTKNNSILALKSTIHHVRNQTSLSINMPIFNGRLLPLEPGIRLYVIYNLKEVGRFEFEAEVIEKFSEGNLHYLTLSVIGETKKSQRRNFYRVQHFETLQLYRLAYPLSEEVKNKIIKAYQDEQARKAEKYKNMKDIILDDEPMEEFFEKAKIECRDISGGGLRAITKVQFTNSEPVKGEFLLDGDRYPFLGKVIRITETMDPLYPYDIGIAFEGMDEVIRTRLIGYVFRKQRNLMKKE